ncbi:MAG: nucleoside monophosphate kinase [Candidatus Doudnabacteria bacterium]
MKRLGFDLIILGSPASGKDTQADLLMNYYDLKPIRSGEYLRRLRENPRYKKIFKQTYDKGLPVPSKIIDDFIKKAVERAPKSKNLLFVGNPRLKNEAILLKKMLDKKKRDFFALYIRLPDALIKKRSFHRDREKSDLDMGYIKSRIKYHKKQVMETIKYFQKFNKVKFINGNQDIIKVALDMKKKIDDYKRSKRN